MGEELELSTIEIDENDADIKSDKLKYPCLILNGVTTVEELNYFINKPAITPYCLPLFLEFSGIYKEINTFDLTLDNLMTLHNISSNYRLDLVKDLDEKRTLELDNPSTYVTLIKL